VTTFGFDPYIYGSFHVNSTNILEHPQVTLSDFDETLPYSVTIFKTKTCKKWAWYYKRFSRYSILKFGTLTQFSILWILKMRNWAEGHFQEVVTFYWEQVSIWNLACLSSLGQGFRFWQKNVVTSPCFNFIPIWKCKFWDINNFFDKLEVTWCQHEM